jgi:Domain of unknown function (DUF4129)
LRVKSVLACATICGMAVVLAALLCAGQGWAQLRLPKAPKPAGEGWQATSMEGYRQHLEELGALVEACAKARNKEVCDPGKVGPDDRVPLTVNGKTEQRRIRLAWLRSLLLSAQTPDKPDADFEARKKEAEKKKEAVTPATTGDLLKNAEQRLKDDAAESEGGGLPMMGWDPERATLKQVLAGKEFRGLRVNESKDSLMERFNRWLNNLFSGMSKLRITAPWMGRALVIGFFVVVCVGLMWGLLQFERRWRVRLVPEGAAVAGAPSARDWQRWMEDARRAAAQGRWREAIHFVYWAAISRLEQKRLWPADKARTPREYLALVADEDARKAGLTQLTRNFERTWYGGRAAGQSDYESAETLATGLIERGSGTGSKTGGAR